MYVDLINIFEVIVLSSLIGSVIILMILIIKGIFMSKLNSTFHYYIWLILLVKLIIPFGPHTTLDISNLFENSYVQTTTNNNTKELQINSPKQLKTVNTDDLILTNTVQPSNKHENSKGTNIPLRLSIEKVLCLMWMFGVVLLTGILISGHEKLRDIVKSSVTNINVSHKEILYKCMKTMNIRNKVELSYSSKINSPSLCGFIKAKILIPVSIASNICDEEFKYIMMHELTHLKNKDIFINWIITLLSLVYWFNPILLYGFHKMRQDCEFSCDNQVISYLGVGGNQQYGNALIRVLEIVGTSNRFMGTTPMVMNSFEVKRRILMISKYKKINIKSILLGTVFFVVIGGVGVALNTSNISSNKSIAKATTLQVKTPVTTSKSSVNNPVSASTSSTIKKSSSYSTNSIVPFSADIVIYNSHPNETYPSGLKVTDVGAILNDKLVKEGFNSHFIKITQPKEYTKSFQNTRDILIKNVKQYSNTILLDLHEGFTIEKKADMKKIQFILTKGSPYYKSNKKFVDSLIGNIKNSNDVKSKIFFFQDGISYYNEDLSNKSALIEFGSNMSSDSDIEACVNAFVSALKNTQNLSVK